MPPGGVPNAANAQLLHASTSISSSTYSGPIPPPDLLKQYDEIEPGVAGRIITLWEDQSRHRMALEKKVINSDIWRSWAGLGAGVLVAFGFLITGGLLVHQDHDTAGATLATAGLASLVGVFVIGTKSQRSERTEKTRMMTGGKRR